MLSFNSAPDYETPGDQGTNNEYDVTVTATDSSGNISNSLSVTITVIDIDEVQPIIVNSVNSDTPSVAENQTVVATFNSNEPVTWSLSGVDSEFFSISTSGAGGTFSSNSESADLSFNSPPDYEAPSDSDSDNIYNVTVNATDSSSNNTEFPMSISVTDQTEASNTNTPPTITLNGTNPQIITLGNS